MKRTLLILSMLSAAPAFADEHTWYAYCIAEHSDVRYCTTPEVKTDDEDTRAKCIAFAEDISSRSYEIQYGTDLEALKASMSEKCDQIKGPDAGGMYACKYASLCPRQTTPRVTHFENRVYASTKDAAIGRCATTNAAKIRQKLKELSVTDCYIKLVADKITITP